MEGIDFLFSKQWADRRRIITDLNADLFSILLPLVGCRMSTTSAPRK
jgi:hypothetical protein